jgi:hypothetical protein
MEFEMKYSFWDEVLFLIEGIAICIVACAIVAVPIIGILALLEVH